MVNRLRCHNLILTFLTAFIVFFGVNASALTFNIDDKTQIVGEVQTVVAKKGDTLFSIGRSHDIGMLEMQEANPKLNPDKAIPVGTNVTIPSEFILPAVPREGIILNVAELRVYYFPANSNTVVTHPVGLGRVGWRTPLGETTIVRKRENPTWTPPESIREASNVDLPESIGPGPHNPLGKYAMNLGWNGYLMHGTNAPTSIGLRSSHGCIRLYPEDIEHLFGMVEVGTPVRVIYEPYKVAVKDGNLYLEAHELFPDNYYQINHNDRFELLTSTITQENYADVNSIDWDNAKELAKETRGYPIKITNN